MKFLVDAQLPRQLAAILNWHGQNARHTMDLPEGNRTPDWRINQISLEEQRVLVTKDADFVNSLLLTGAPYKLLLVVDREYWQSRHSGHFYPKPAGHFDGT